MGTDIRSSNAIRKLQPQAQLNLLEHLKREAFNLRFQQATGHLKDTSRMRKVKKGIARVKTVMSEQKRFVQTQDFEDFKERHRPRLRLSVPERGKKSGRNAALTEAPEVPRVVESWRPKQEPKASEMADKLVELLAEMRRGKVGSAKKATLLVLEAMKQNFVHSLPTERNRLAHARELLPRQLFDLMLAGEQDLSDEASRGLVVLSDKFRDEFDESAFGKVSNHDASRLVDALCSLLEDTGNTLFWYLNLAEIHKVRSKIHAQVSTNLTRRLPFTLQGSDIVVGDETSIPPEIEPVVFCGPELEISSGPRLSSSEGLRIGDLAELRFEVSAEADRLMGTQTVFVSIPGFSSHTFFIKPESLIKPL
ncbi:MAG: 50S ribosomal protein L29 [Mangrovicoccus sp.]